MDKTELSFREVNRLGLASFALKEAVRSKKLDEDNSSKPGIVNIYFVDPAIVLWFCKPYESQNLSGFEGSLRQKNEEGQHNSLTTSLLTLDFIFSNVLPGSSGLPLFISSYHADELSHKIDKELIDHGRDGAVETPDLAQVKQEWADALETLTSIGASETMSDLEGVDRVFRGVNELLKKPISSTTFGQGRFIDLINRELVAKTFQHPDLFWSHSDADADAKDDGHAFPEAGHRNTAQWSTWLSEGFRTERSDNIRRDAQTLAALEYLNEQARGREPLRRYLFITTDSAVHRAMNSWVREESKSGERDSFARHPRQYIPLFNLSADLEVSQNLRQAIEDLAAGFRISSSGSGAKERFVLEDAPGVEIPNLATHALDALATRAIALREEWKAAMRTAALLNFDSLQKTTSQLLNDVIKVIDEDLSSGRINKILTSSLHTQTNRILRTNRAFSIRGRLTGSMSIDKKRGKEGVARARLPILFDFPLPQRVFEFAEGRHVSLTTMSSLLDWLVRQPGGDSGDLLTEFEKLLEDLNDTEAYALAAAVVFKAKSWSAVRHFAQSYENAARRQEERSRDVLEEIRYCKRVAERFLSSEFPEFQTLRQSWQWTYLTGRGSNLAFRRARALSEMAAVDLVCVFRARVMESFTVENGLLLRFNREASRKITSALAIVRDNRAIGDPDLWLGLEEQLITNRAACLFQLFILFEEAVGEEDQRDMNRALNLLKSNNSRRRIRPHSMPRMYEYALGAILAKTPDEQSGALDSLAKMLNLAKQEGDFESNEVDRALFDWFEQIRQARMAALTTATA